MMPPVSRCLGWREGLLPAPSSSPLHWGLWEPLPHPALPGWIRLESTSADRNPKSHVGASPAQAGGRDAAREELIKGRICRKFPFPLLGGPQGGTRTVLPATVALGDTRHSPRLCPELPLPSPGSPGSPLTPCPDSSSHPKSQFVFLFNRSTSCSRFCWTLLHPRSASKTFPAPPHPAEISGRCLKPAHF